MHFLEIAPDSWKDVKMIGEQLAPYNFRGQSDEKWPLSTSEERLFEKYSEKDAKKTQLEIRVLSKFKSRAHQYIQSPPSEDDNIEWLSIIQDYGGPTRLLDFTHSFYVAAFFAMESASGDACIWSISEYDLWFRSVLSRKLVTTLFESDKHYYYDSLEHYNNIAQTIIRDPKQSVDFVVKILPARLNERLAVQKGLFLFNCNIENSFEKSLCRTFNFPFDFLNSDTAIRLNTREFLDLPKPPFNEKLIPINLAKEQQKNTVNDQSDRDNTSFIEGHFSIAPIVKIKLSKDIYKEALIDLDNMNINYASLFPGLEGFAKSMKHYFLVPDLGLNMSYTVG